MSAANIDQPVAAVGIAVLAVWALAYYAKPVACAIGRRIDRWAAAGVDRMVAEGLQRIESEDLRNHADQAMTVGNSANVDARFAEIVERERAEGWSA